MATGTSSHSARDRLLEAASEEVAAALGPGQVSLRAIARRAGLSHNAAEHHFQDRAGLLTALAVQGFDQLEGDLRAALAAAARTGAHPLAALGGAYLTFGLTEPNTLELMFRADLVRPQDPDLEQASSEPSACLKKPPPKPPATFPQAEKATCQKSPGPSSTASSALPATEHFALPRRHPIHARPNRSLETSWLPSPACCRQRTRDRQFHLFLTAARNVHRAPER